MRAVITDYGAVGDGTTLNTAEVQAAVDACEAGGGGTVVVPRGVFVTGSIELKSKVTLYLEQGGVLRASPSIHDYRVLPVPSDEFKVIQPWLYALEQTDVRLAGEGELDMNDEPFMDWNKLWMADEYASELDERQLSEVIVTPRERPSQMVFFHKCRQVRVEGIVARRSPFYTFSVSVCRDVRFEGVRIDNNLRIPNNDGIHFYSCQDVVIHGCVFSCGDDCIAITGISNWDTVCERFVISDCSMRSRSSAVRMGFLKSKVRDIAVSNVVIHDTNRGFGIFAGDEGWVRDVTISNVIMHTRLIAGAWWGKGEPLLISAADSAGQIEGISVSHVRAHSENGIHIVGCETNIRDVSLSGWRLTLSPGPNRPLFGKFVDLSPVAPRPAPEDRIPWLYATEASGIYLHNIRADSEPGTPPIGALIEGCEDLVESDTRVG